MSCSETIFLILFAVVVWVVANVIWNANRIRKLARSRPGESYETFRASFAVDAVPEEILLSVYAKLQWHSSGGFPSRADDCLWKIHRLGAEDFEDAVAEVLAECHRELPHNFRELGPVVVDTVRDFAMFVEACPIKTTRRSA